MNAIDPDALVATVQEAADSATHHGGRPRILFLIRTFGRGGAQRQLVVLASGLQRAGWEVSAACFYAGDAFERELTQANVQVIDLGKRGRWDVVGFGWRLWRTLRQQDADIVHGYLTVGNLLALLARLAHWHTRVVWGVRSAYMDRSRYDWMARATFRLSCHLARLADLIIVNSQAGAEHHAALGYPRGRIRVVANGIDTHRFRFDADGRARVREEWSIPDAAVLVGLVGRIDPMKDHGTFLRAAAELARRDARWLFACVGEGHTDYAAALRSEADALGLAGRLIWTGARQDMPAVYSAFDLAASTSYGEGFPNVIAEAMACGRRCVVTDVGDSARIVGNCGVVVPPHSPVAVADALEALWCATGGLPAAAAARTRIVACYSVPALLTSTQATLRNLRGVRRYT
ncbi:MAG TPA: glycosyltransferase [Rhodanobacteraceae bacterium]|nr:glycosyltransferase [Rhodanobacteraceae bacterium]